MIGPDPDTMAAYYTDQEVEDGQQDGNPPSRESVWKTRDGRHIAIKDMDDNHLLNTIRVLAGESPEGTVVHTDSIHRRHLINVMANEAYRRGLTPKAKEDP